MKLASHTGPYSDGYCFLYSINQYNTAKACNQTQSMIWHNNVSSSTLLAYPRSSTYQIRHAWGSAHIAVVFLGAKTGPRYYGQIFLRAISWKSSKTMFPTSQRRLLTIIIVNYLRPQMVARFGLRALLTQVLRWFIRIAFLIFRRILPPSMCSMRRILFFLLNKTILFSRWASLCRS